VPSPGNPQSLNRYAYALNNPVKYTDPTGHYIFEEDPSDPWIYSDPKVRSKQYYTHPEYKQGEITDAQFVAATTSPIWVPITAVVGAEEAGELWSIAHGGIKALIALITGVACADGNCTNEVEATGEAVREAAQNGELVGYHGTSSIHVPSLLRGIKDFSGANFRGWSQLGRGFYTTTDREAAQWFAEQAVENARAGTPTTVEVYVQGFSEMNLGVDYLEAPISGFPQWPQIKFEPHTFGNIFVRLMESGK
jgi:hypothetical protein